MRGLLDQLQVLFKPISRRREVEGRGALWEEKEGNFREIEGGVFETEGNN